MRTSTGSGEPPGSGQTRPPAPDTTAPPERATGGGRVIDITRADARKRIEKRRGLQVSLLAYVVVNGFLVAVWALADGGYFWPVWVMAAWGLGLVFQVWDYYRGPVTEADVDAEVQRMRGR